MKKNYKDITDAKKAADFLDRLSDRLNKPKPKSKLLKKKKSNIPGIGYWFSPKN